MSENESVQAPESTNPVPPAEPDTPPATWAEFRESIATEFDKVAPAREGALLDLEAGQLPDDDDAEVPEGQPVLRDPATGQFVTATPPVPDPGKPVEGEPAATPAPSSRFTALGADGQPVAFELPGVVQFKADGREVKVESADELVQLAQKGVHYDRRMAQVAEKEAAVEATLEEERKRYDDLLLAAVFDDAMRRELAQKLAPFRDPVAREALEKADKFDRQQALEAQRKAEAQEAERAEARTGLWERVEQDYGAKLAEYPNLTAEDFPLISQQFYALWEAQRTTLYNQHYDALVKQGHPEATARQAIEAEAAKVLHPDTLYAVMDKFNRRLTAPAGGPPPANAPTSRASAPPAQVPTASTPQERRQYIADKLAQGQQRNLRSGGGSPPSATPSDAMPEDASFADKLAHMKATLDGREPRPDTGEPDP